MFGNIADRFGLSSKQKQVKKASAGNDPQSSVKKFVPTKVVPGEMKKSNIP